MNRNQNSKNGILILINTSKESNFYTSFQILGCTKVFVEKDVEEGTTLFIY